MYGVASTVDVTLTPITFCRPTTPLLVELTLVVVAFVLDFSRVAAVDVAVVVALIELWGASLVEDMSPVVVNSSINDARFCCLFSNVL